MSNLFKRANRKGEMGFFYIVRMLTEFYWPYLVVLVIVIIYIMCKSFSFQTEASYIPENIPQSVENQETIGWYEMEYNYYLDFSPSMSGFFNGDINIVMSALADSLQTINQDLQNANFYRCSERFETVSASEFYDSMKSESALNSHYDGILEDISKQLVEESYYMGEEEELIDIEEEENRDNEEISSQIFMERLEEINLSDLFIRRYDDNRAFSNSDNSVNMIITDLNFYLSAGDEARQEKYMEAFASRLGEAFKNTNFCAIQLASAFSGRATDEYSLESGGIANGNDYYFYVFISVKDKYIYDLYMEELEKQFKNVGINAFEKFELTLQDLRDNASFSVDINSLSKSGRLEKENFNYDNKAFIGLAENEFGMRMVYSDETGNRISRLRLPVADLTIPGYYENEEEGSNESKIQVQTDIYYPSGKSFVKYEGNDIVRLSQAAIQSEDGRWTLGLILEMNAMEPEFASRWFGQKRKKSYFVTDIRFFMEQPEYTIPEWADGVKTVLESIIEQKEKSFIALDKNERYIGNIIMYVNY